MTEKVQESSAAQATLRPANKSEMINKAILKMAGMSIEDLSHYLNDTLAQVGHEADGVKDASAANQATLNMKPSAASSAMKASVKEDLSVIFGEGEELSEEIKDSVSSLFEAALETRLTVEREALVEEFDAKLDEAYETLAEEMAEKVDAYLNALAEEWLEENKVAIESALRNELVDDFLTGLKNLFAEHYIDVPEDKVDVVEELALKVADLETTLDKTLVENASLKAVELNNKKNELVNSVCEGLALTTAEKLRSLAENLEFDGDLDVFTSKVNTIKENLMTAGPASSTQSSGIITEESDPNASPQNDVVVHPDVARYMTAISRSVRGR